MSNYAATPLSRRLAAVAMTYTTRPMIHWAVGIGLVIVTVVTLLSGRWHRSVDSAAWPIFSFWPIVFGTLIALQSKSQFVTPAARLVPNYRTPHFTAFTSLTILFLGIAPLSIASTLGLAPMGTAALAICLGSLTVWCFYNPFTALPSFVALASLYRSDVARFWMDPSLLVWPMRLMLLAAGWCSFALWLRRLATMHEERSDYVIPPMAASVLRPSRSARAEQRNFVARQLNHRRWQVAWLLDPRVDSALAYRPPLSKAALVRLGLGPYSALTRATYIAVLFGGMWIVMMEWLKLPRESIAAQILFIGSLVPGFVIFVQIDEKRSQLEGDLLRPMTRSDFYAVLIGGYLRDLAIVVGAFILMAIFLAARYLPNLLSIAVAIAFAAQVATSNVLISAANFHLASRFGALPRMAILFAPLIGMLAVNVWMWRLLDDYGVGPILACAAVYAAIAVLTLRAAHRRWLNVEVG